MNANHELGKKGEDIACIELKRLGYTILERNWRYRRLEVDIIARTSTELILVEVKTRSTARYGYPEIAIDRAKKSNLYKAAGIYAYEKDLDIDIRFDIISVILYRNVKKVFHIKDAFFPY